MLSIDSGLDDMKDLPPPPPYDQVSMLQNFFNVIYVAIDITSVKILGK
jgi:hypothetical protein